MCQSLFWRILFLSSDLSTLSFLFKNLQAFWEYGQQRNLPSFAYLHLYQSKVEPGIYDNDLPEVLARFLQKVGQDTVVAMMADHGKPDLYDVQQV